MVINAKRLLLILIPSHQVPIGCRFQYLWGFEEKSRYFLNWQITTMLGETSNCGNLQAKWKVRWFVSLCGKLLWLFFKDPFKRRVFFTLQATISRYLPAILAVIKQAMVAANRVLIAILAMSLCRLGAIGPKPPSNTPRPRKLKKPQSAYVAMTSDRRYKRWDQENVIQF